jgi:hypothetical protein
MQKEVDIIRVFSRRKQSSRWLKLQIPCMWGSGSWSPSANCASPRIP